MPFPCFPTERHKLFTDKQTVVLLSYRESFPRSQVAAGERALAQKESHHATQVGEVQRLLESSQRSARDDRSNLEGQLQALKEQLGTKVALGRAFLGAIHK